MKAALTRIGLLLGLVIQLSACETGGELAPSPPDEPPPAAKAESALTSTNADDLFPEALGENMVCMRAKPQPNEDGVLVDCLQCPNCNLCFWDIVHVNITTGKETTLETVEGLLSAPHLAGDRAYWLSRDGNDRAITIENLTTGKRTLFKLDSGQWIAEVPTLQGDWLYWSGYNQSKNQKGLVRANIVNGTKQFLFAATFQDIDYSQGGQLERVAKRQPFVVTSDGVYWVTTKGPGRSIRRWRFDTKNESTLVQKSSVEMFALAAGDGFIAWKERVNGNCYSNGACGIAIRGYIFGEGAVDLTPSNAKISRYAHLSIAGDIVFWADYREGPYAIFGRDVFHLNASELRYTSQSAVIGSWTSPTVTEFQLVWMDGRDESWNIFSRPL